jgi:hypothetical protein
LSKLIRFLQIYPKGKTMDEYLPTDTAVGTGNGAFAEIALVAGGRYLIPLNSEREQL